MSGVAPPGRSAQHPLHPRDTDATAFTSILAELIAHIPGAHSAALVDPDGESVDYTGRVPPFDAKLAGAQFRVTFDELRARPFWRDVKTLVVRGSTKSFLVRALADGYAIVVIMGKRSGFSPSARALSVCQRALENEAGLSGEYPLRLCMPVAVNCDSRRKPTSVASPRGGASRPLEVLGSVMGLANRERGFRVRLDTGAEVILVRERGGAWYSEEPIDFSPRKKNNDFPR
jgi:hypothetical protein